jgi:hypothetical protein
VSIRPVHGREDSEDVGDATDIPTGDRLKLVDAVPVSPLPFTELPPATVCPPLTVAPRFVLTNVLGFIGP